jgi:P27 family predicted phage terminase small subunit
MMGQAASRMGGQGSGGSRRTKPAWLRKQEGNRGHREIPEPMPVNNAALPKPPDHFTDEQRKCWDEICIALPRGVLVRADANVVQRCAVAWALYNDCTASINKTGLIYKAPNGMYMRNPMLVTRNMAARELATCSMEIGLSPLARTRIGNGVSTIEQDPMDILMSGDSTAWDFSMEKENARN